MWLLIIKLRSAQQNQLASTAESKQYRKAAKALLVLIPLLGLGYVLLLVTPTQNTWRFVFKISQAVLTSTQVSKTLSLLGYYLFNFNPFLNLFFRGSP